MTTPAPDIVERFRDAQLNHDEFRFGWLAEANDELTSLREERASLRRRVAELEAVVERLPKTADGGLISECEVLFFVHVDVDQPMVVRECVFDLVNREAFVTFHKAQYMVSAHCYSTREAAEAAAAKQKGDE